MLEDHLKNVQDELGTTQVIFLLKERQVTGICYFRDFLMHVKMKLKLKII
jgi:hypothetical protein